MLARRLATTLSVALLGLAAAMSGPAAGVLPQRTFVSGGGSDANTASGCSLVSPCRGFGAALTVTRPGGEIIVLDSAGYGTVSIAQAVAIVSPPGVYAGISVQSGDGITVTAGGNDTVRLAGLTITGLGGNNGVVVTSVGTFVAENLVVIGFLNNGMLITGSGLQWVVRGSHFIGNGGKGLEFTSGSSVGALHVEGSGFEKNHVGLSYNASNPVGTIVSSTASRNDIDAFVVSAGRVQFSDCRADNYASGAVNHAVLADGAATFVSVDRCVSSGIINAFYATNGAQLTITDASAIGPGVGLGTGLGAFGSGLLVAERVAVSHFFYGVEADSGGIVRVSNSTITGNSSGLANFAGTIESRQNNSVVGNGTPTSGTMASFTPL